MITLLLVSSDAPLIHEWTARCNEFDLDVRVFHAMNLAEAENLLFGGIGLAHNIIPELVVCDSRMGIESVTLLVGRLRRNQDTVQCPLIVFLAAGGAETGKAEWQANSVVRLGEHGSTEERTRFMEVLHYWLERNHVLRNGEPRRLERVLIVDDQPLPQIWLERELKKLGVKVELAADAMGALVLQRKRPFDLVFVDLIMPEVDGYELGRRLTQFYPQTAIVAMTGSPELANVAEILQIGFKAFLAKGSNHQAIVEVLAMCGFETPGSTS